MLHSTMTEVLEVPQCRGSLRHAVEHNDEYTRYTPTDMTDKKVVVLYMAIYQYWIVILLICDNPGGRGYPFGAFLAQHPGLLAHY